MQRIFEKCRETALDLDFKAAVEWKGSGADRVIIGYLPIYFPREIIHAMNGLPVGIMGVGDNKQVIKGDAYYQSYICRMPRGVVELLLDGHLDDFDGFLFPSICDVIRNLSGIFKVLRPGVFAKYFDFPQNFDKRIGGTFYRTELQHVIDSINKINGVELSEENLRNSIDLFNKNRRLLSQIRDIIDKYPWRMSAENWYYLQRGGLGMPVEEHNSYLEQVLSVLSTDINEPMDRIRVVITGAFCEQPPVGLIKTIENSGCYVVEDDLMLGSHWIDGDVEHEGMDPIDALVEAYLERSAFSSSVYDVGNPKSDRLIEIVKKRNADGVLFASPSFCDPALLDHPEMQKALEKEGIRYIGIQYAENSGQFKVIKEQVGAFSDSIKLWENEPVIQE